MLWLWGIGNSERRWCENASPIDRWRQRECIRGHARRLRRAAGPGLEARAASGEGGEARLESGERYRDADPFLRGLEEDERRGLAAAELAEELILQHHLRHASVRDAADEPGLADVALINLEGEARSEQHAERGEDAHDARPSVGRLEDDHRQPDVVTVLGGDELHEDALLAGGPGRRVAADLPVAVGGADRRIVGGRDGDG